jgi:hypothetical protein
VTALRGFIEVQVISERVLMTWTALPKMKFRSIRVRDIEYFEKAKDYDSTPDNKAPTEIRLKNGWSLLVNQSYPLVRHLIEEAL